MILSCSGGNNEKVEALEWLTDRPKGIGIGKNVELFPVIAENKADAINKLKGRSFVQLTAETMEVFWEKNTKHKGKFVYLVRCVEGDGERVDAVLHKNILSIVCISNDRNIKEVSHRSLK